MKASSTILAALTAVLLSCNILEPPLPMEDTSRREDETPVEAADGGGTAAVEPPELPDTVFVVSAAVFPDDYDWQRDSAFGAVACSVRLYRNATLALEIPAGPEARVAISPDRHHIIGSALFTEYADGLGTTVKKDGETLAEWDGQEKLQGLLVKNRELHTLGLAVPGGALTYRRNGNLVMKVDGGIPLGGFGQDGYGPEGALYEDDGHVCFAYKNVFESSQTVTLVRDGAKVFQQAFERTIILDARICGPRNILLYTSGGNMMLEDGDSLTTIGKRPGLRCESGKIVNFRGRTSVAGVFRDGKRNALYGIYGGNAFYRIDGTPAYIYCSGDNYGWMEQPPEGYPDCYFFNRNCACLLDDGMAVVLSPKSPGALPFLKYRSRITEFNLHGYLSGIAVEIPE